MVIGHLFMTAKAITNTVLKVGELNTYKKLSIQVSLNGLSFFILDTISTKLVLTDCVSFQSQSTPYLLLKALKEVIDKHQLHKITFSSVSVIHKSDLFCLVPKVLFDAKELANYLKFNTKLLANDHIVYDEIETQEIISVYVPFTNINNLIFELFGEFEFKHHSTVVLQTLLHQKISAKKACYVHVNKKSFELAVFDQKRLILFNQFNFDTKEDFLYYILFVYEQLQLDAESVKLKLFGQIEDNDELFEICYRYIKKVSVFEPKNGTIDLDYPNDKSIDLTLLNSF